MGFNTREPIASLMPTDTPRDGLVSDKEMSRQDTKDAVGFSNIRTGTRR